VAALLDELLARTTRPAVVVKAHANGLSMTHS
jgi:hypothetical protein